MPKSATITVDPELLKWARESAGLSETQAAKKVGLKPPERYPEWEAAGRPTPRQLERLADAVKRPVLAFFLPNKPSEPPAPADFRVAPNTARPELSSTLRFVIRRARRVLRIYEELGGAPLREVGASLTLTRDMPAHVGAAQARNLLGVSLEEQASWGSAAIALEKWRDKLENLGILVLQFNMTGETVSGFSLSNGTPAIVLNKSDHESRRCFTLFHEWAHLLLGEPGLCNVDEGDLAPVDAGVEAYCNAFAAEALVPLSELRDTGAFADLVAREDIERAVSWGVKRYGVSRWVMLIRSLTARLIPHEVFDQTVDLWNAQPLAKKKGGRSYPHRKAVQNLGLPYVSRVMTAREAGEITDAEASDYLNLKLRWFPELEALLPSR